MANKTTVVHVTHETVGKIGGIGAVLQGLFTCNYYLEAVDRSILVGPLFTTEGTVLDRLGQDGDVLYSSIDGLIKTGYDRAFRKIENFYNAGIVYGTRTFTDSQTGITSSPEVLLIDVRHMHKGPIDEFKRFLFEAFGIRSDLYENLWEYEQYVRAAPPIIDALKAIGATKNSTTVIAHEFMGMPTALAAVLDTTCDFNTVFYAHEVATMRRIVEEHPGHDTMFYNVIKKAYENKLCVNEVFGDQSSYFKHSLVEASRYCDHICAVGDYVVDELKFLAPEFKTTEIDIVYNGIPAYQISVDDKLNSKAKLQRYCHNLLGFKPDYVFTHVTRLITSKGLWRDLRVLYELEQEFKKQNKIGVFFLLSTQVRQRLSNDIYKMESAYGWPVAHREGWPDLSGGEANFYTAIQDFNARCANLKIIFINQFGFNRKTCGWKMPQDMDFTDIRRGTDVEFGQSIYEPFGISQLEPLTFGGICVISSVCGCSGFLRDITCAEKTENVIVADYTDIGNRTFDDTEDLLLIDQRLRSEIEVCQSKKVTKKILSLLPQENCEVENLIQAGYSAAKNMSWDIVVKKYLLPALQKTHSRRPKTLCHKA